MSKVINTMKKTKEDNFNIVNILIVFVGIILLVITFVLFRSNQVKSLENLSNQTESLADIYVHEIEERFSDIEKIVEITSIAGFPQTSIAKKDWNLQTSFYISDYDGLERIVLVDQEMKVFMISSLSDEDITIGASINDYDMVKGHITLLYPVVEDDAIKGLVYGEIAVDELFKSTALDAKEGFLIDIYKENELVYSSDQEIQAKDSYAVSKMLILNDTATYQFKIIPSQELFVRTVSNAYMILIFGTFMSVLIFVLFIFILKYSKKSIALTKLKDRLIDNKRQLEEQIGNQQKLEAIGTLASGVAHEINNPINGIMNYSQIIYDSYEEAHENKQYTYEIIEETKRVSSLVQNILQFSSQKKNTGSIASITDIIEKSMMLMNTIFKKDHIAFETHLESNLPNIFCNSQQIQQVIMNVLANARDALNDRYEGYHENKKVIIYCNQINSNEKKYIRIIIEDLGTGIEEHVLENMFAQFYTTKKAGEGTGLGLAISRNIIKEHGGDIKVETKLGEYTKIYIDLPCKV